MAVGFRKRLAVYRKTGGHCAYCGKALEPESFVVEHTTPARRSGSDDLDNLLPACQSCNTIKRHRTLDEFREYARQRSITLIETALEKTLPFLKGEGGEETRRALNEALAHARTAEVRFAYEEVVTAAEAWQVPPGQRLVTEEERQRLLAWVEHARQHRVTSYQKIRAWKLHIESRKLTLERASEILSEIRALCDQKAGGA